MYRMIASLFGLAVMIVFAPPASAQYTGQLPGGNWQQTCANIRWDGDILVADCRDVHGEMVYTRWDTRSGSARVENCNGDLVATTNCQTAPAMRAPRGSWRRQPCDFAIFRGSVMVAYCYENGRSRQIQFDTAQGVFPLELCGEGLVREGSCGRSPTPASNAQPGTGGKPQAGVSPQPAAGTGRSVATNANTNTSANINSAQGFPSGAWQQTCRNPRWEGRTLVATCQTSYGAWVYSSFDTNLAFTTLSNCDGILRPVARCEDFVIATPAPAARTPLPSGSWASACSRGSIENGVLSAVCRQPGRWVQRPSDNRYIWEEGGLVSVRLPLNGYTGPVSFCNGQLQRGATCPGD